MAVAMEVAWRGVELGGGGSTSTSAVSKKRAWGADTQKLMHLMMGQFGAVPPADVTLDLLGAASAPCPRELHSPSSPDFLELDPDQPLPSNWEKCLDLKTGEVYFVSKSTGVRTSEDPRKQSEAGLQAHEFLGSKMSETLREESLRVSTSSGSSGGSPPQLLSFSTGKQLWNLQLDDRSTVSLNKTGSSPRAFPCSSDEESNLELNLNLSAGGTSPSHQHHQSVCTMEMVEQALKRTEKAMGKREMPGSSSFSSLTSEPNSWSHSSPSTSSSSSTSSRSAAHLDDSQQALRSSAPPGGCEAESRKAEGASDALVMGACTRCLMYVMLHKSDPKCPRCGSEVPLDFTSPPSSKRQRVEALIQAS